MFTKVAPGDQVIVVPDWVLKNLAIKGRVEDLVNFSKMRQWFTQEQLVAIERFSKDGMNVLWSFNGELPPQGDPGQLYTRSLGYIWFFPEESGQSDTTNEADIYARSQLSQLCDVPEYASRLTNQYIIDHLRDVPKDTVDLSQSYSVYSASDKLIVVVLNQGILSPIIFKRKEELRISILRSVVEKLHAYYDMSVVHQTNWFSWYLTELDNLK